MQCQQEFINKAIKMSSFRTKTNKKHKINYFEMFKGTVGCLQSRLTFISGCDSFGPPKNHECQPLCATCNSNAAWSTQSGQYVHIKLRKGTHELWTDMKQWLFLKSDDALACWLISSIQTSLLTDDLTGGGSEQRSDSRPYRFFYKCGKVCIFSKEPDTLPGSFFILWC